jgi:hypothetical protein
VQKTYASGPKKPSLPVLKFSMTNVNLEMRFLRLTLTRAGYKMREHLPAAPGLLSRVTPPSTKWARCFLTSVFRWYVQRGKTPFLATLLEVPQQP